MFHFVYYEKGFGIRITGTNIVLGEKEVSPNDWETLVNYVKASEKEAEHGR